jgi:hypothetical protein
MWIVDGAAMCKDKFVFPRKVIDVMNDDGDGDGAFLLVVDEGRPPFSFLLLFPPSIL